MIRQVRIRGDLLLSNHDAMNDLERALCHCTLQEAQTAVQAACLPVSTRESLFRLLEKLGPEAGVAA